MKIPFRKKNLVKDNIKFFTQNNPKQIQKYLVKFLSKYYNEELIQSTPDFILVHGDIPICLVAHMDTVFEKNLPKSKIYHDKVTNSCYTVKSNRGLGADDRAGIVAVMELIRKGHRPNLLFTHGEESGLTGAQAFTSTYQIFPYECKYFIEIDRQGVGEAVYYNDEPLVFQDYVSSFGLTTNYGTCSDISELGSAYKIAGVNISAGYVNEHYEDEILYLDALDYSIKVIDRMLKDQEEADFFKTGNKYPSYGIVAPETSIPIEDRIDKALERLYKTPAKDSDFKCSINPQDTKDSGLSSSISSKDNGDIKATM